MLPLLINAALTLFYLNEVGYKDLLRLDAS